MNTRSSSASRRRQMTVDFSSRHAENSSCVAVCQSNVDICVNHKYSNVERDLKKTSNDLCNFGEEELGRVDKSHDRSFGGKEDLNLSCGVTTRSSSRPCKRSRNGSPTRSLVSTQEPSTSTGKRLKRCSKPQKRQWESWGAKEKDCFFEALLEYSKDFDKIHTHLMNGHKRRGDLSSVVKNKDQVRHFYYRTLNKISKYIPEPQDNLDSKKTSHEVHSLLCYGELRKKLHILKEKDGKKLTELISTGKTTVRHHGRNLNIRAPVCRALKKLNPSLVDEPEHVPNKITIELIPGDNEAWSSIQGLAYNPRLRTTVSSRKSVYSLLTYLISKWKLSSNTSITLSPARFDFSPVSVISKRNDYETVSRSKQLCDGRNDCNEEEGVSDSSEPLKDRTEDASTVITENVNVATSTASNETKVVNTEFERISDLKDPENAESSDVPEVLSQEKWGISNCSNLTIADLYRKLGHPRKVSLSYSLSKEEPKSQTLTTHALEHLVKLAAGEFSCRADVRNGSKKDPLNMASSKAKSVSKDITTTVSKPNKVPKSSSKSAMKPPKLAPKPLQEPSLVIPSVVPSVINQVSTSASSRSGNHLTFGFTPINSLQSPSPFLPKMKKNRKSRVVVQRTLLPRPITGVVSALGKESSPHPFVPSPARLANSGHDSSDDVSVSSAHMSAPSSTHEQHSSPNGERQILSQKTNRRRNGDEPASNGLVNVTLPSPLSHDSNAEFCVESLINLALGQDLSDNGQNVVEKLLEPSKSANQSASSCIDRNSRNLVYMSEANVCTEEIDSGMAGGGKTPKETNSLVEAIEHLDNNKNCHSVGHSNDLLENLRSSEDEDPLKLLSPGHTQQFHSEAWLSEESCDFSLSNIFANMGSSPPKQRNSSILDTPKKSQSDLSKADCPDIHDNISKYSHPEPVFCDMVDESSVDYVKKFRDLAKKMSNDTEAVSNSREVADSLPSSNSNSTVSFNALLSDATSRD